MFLLLAIICSLLTQVNVLFSEVGEAIYVITSAVKDVCGKPPTERLFLDKYGKICLCLDEIVWKVRVYHFISPSLIVMCAVYII